MLSNIIAFKKVENFFLLFLFFIYFALSTANLMGQTATQTTISIKSQQGAFFTFEALVMTQTNPVPVTVGQVHFFDETSPIDGFIDLTSNGTADLSIGLLPGEHAILAEYLGSAGFDISTSNVLMITVPSPVPPPSNIFPPRHLKGIQKFKECAFVNILTWEAPNQGDTPVAYRIFRSVNNRNTKMIAEIPSTGKLKFNDHRVKKGKIYTYGVVSVDASGALSGPALVTIKSTTRFGL